MSFLGRKVNKILLKIQKGDEKHKNILLDTTWNHLLKIAYRYAYIKADAEDILVEAFSRAFDYINAFNNEKDGYNWLCTIVKNVAIDLKDKQKRNKMLPLEVADYILPQERDFSQEIATKDLFDRLLKPYSEQDKNLLTLYLIDNFTFREIAIQTGMTKSNAHKRVRKMIDEITKKIKK